MAWLNYHHLLYFYTVAREGSVARASAALNLTQPTISTQVRMLERALGDAAALPQIERQRLRPCRRGQQRRENRRKPQRAVAPSPSLGDSGQDRAAAKRPTQSIEPANATACAHNRATVIAASCRHSGRHSC